MPDLSKERKVANQCRKNEKSPDDFWKIVRDTYTTLKQDGFRPNDGEGVLMNRINTTTASNTHTPAKQAPHHDKKTPRLN